MSGEYKTTPPNPAQTRRTLWILWAALLSSHGVYALLAAVGTRTDPAPDPAQAAALLVPFAAVAAIQASFSFFGVDRFFAPRPDAPMPAAFQTPFLLKMALAESVAIVGLALRFVGAPLGVFLAFVVPAVLLQVSYAPTDDALASFERRLRLRQPR